MIKYQISEQTNNRLVIKLVREKLRNDSLAIIAGILLVTATFYYVNGFEKIGLVIIYIIVLVGAAGLLFRNYKLIKDGEEFIFDKQSNQVSLNNISAGKLTDIAGLEIIVTEEDELTPEDYKLLVKWENSKTIEFKKSQNKNEIRKIGNVISEFVEVPCVFKSIEELYDQEILKQEKLSYQSMVETFEFQFKNKSEKELIEISKKDSVYGNHAKEAAMNLLEIIQGKQTPNNV